MTTRARWILFSIPKCLHGRLEHVDGPARDLCTVRIHLCSMTTGSPLLEALLGMHNVNY